MIDQWKKPVDNNKIFGALLTDLLKAFDCICHDLLIVKLNAYGLPFPALKMTQNHLQNRKQGRKIGSSCSNWQDITFGIPQGSVLGSLYLRFYFVNYADDTSPYTVGGNTTELTNLSSLAQKPFTWFGNNKMKTNHDRPNLLLRTQESSNIQIANFTVKSSKAKKTAKNQS